MVSAQIKIVIEDDAVPVIQFMEKEKYWLGEFPDDLVSFYLGVGRPPQRQTTIAHMLRDADKSGKDYIALQQLLHGVCYSLPVDMVGQVLARMNRNEAADYAIGNSLRQLTDRPIIYPVFSLVDHADLPSVEQHPSVPSSRHNTSCDRKKSFYTLLGIKTFYNLR